jgi:hypothetical protein
MDHDTPASKRPTSAIFLSVSLFVLTPFLFGPARIAIGNYLEFAYPFHESMLVFFAASFLLILVLFLAVLAVSRRPTACRIIVSMLTMAGFLMWLQGNILVWQYGVLDGKDIDWDAFVRYGIMDSVLWAAVMAFAILEAGLVFRVSRLASVALVTIQLVSVTLTWIQMPKDQSFRRQETATESLHRYSDHVNVMVLDTFQSDIFQDIVEANDDLKASFDGFTYFRNSLSGSAGTIVSIPNMLTGSSYDNTVPHLDFVKTSFLGNSLPKTLREYGFRVDQLLMMKSTVYGDFSLMPSAGKTARNWNAFLEEQAFLADLALFRSLPQFMKEMVYNDQEWFISGLLERYPDPQRPVGTWKNVEREVPASPEHKFAKELESSKTLLPKHWDIGFLDTMLSTSGILKNEDAFKLIHLGGIHLRLRMNEALLYEVMDATRANMVRQGTGALKIATMYLERLRQLKVCDNSLIFIVGDHGSGIADALLDPSPLGERFNTGGPYPGSFEKFKAMGVPLILVKRIDSRGAMKTSDAPVCLGDIPQTVVEELGLDARFPGRSMFGVKEDEKRERIYRAFVGPQEDVEYLAPLYEYSVNGFSWDDASWKETGNVYYAKPKQPVEVIPRD